MRISSALFLSVFTIAVSTSGALTSAAETLPAPRDWGMTVSLDTEASSKAHSQETECQLPICTPIVSNGGVSNTRDDSAQQNSIQRCGAFQKSSETELPTPYISLAFVSPTEVFDSCGPVTPPTAVNESEHRTVAYNVDEFQAPIEPIPETDLRFRSPAPEFMQTNGTTSGWVGCGEACCPSFANRCVSDEYGRNLTGYVGGMFLRRSAPDKKAIATSPTTGGRFDASDFEFGTQGGIEAGLIAHQLLCDVDFELRFFSVSDLTAAHQRRLNGPVTVIGTQIPLALPGVRDVSGQYESTIQNVEANLRYRYGGGWNWLTLIAGFRYLNLNESLDVRFTNLAGVPGPETAGIDTRNNLYGFQIGMDKSICGTCRYSIEAYGRAGIYGNNSESRTNVSAPGGLTPGFSTNGSDTSAAFVGEFGLKGSYQVLDGVRVFGRYSVLAIDGVAQASDQLASANSLSRTGHSGNSNVFFHGATAGVELIF